jgi:hypothetical protein
MPAHGSRSTRPSRFRRDDENLAQRRLLKGRRSAASAMLHTMLPKMKAWKGATAHQ